MGAFNPGDRVYVTDPALAEMRAIMAKHGEEVLPNHTGTVSDDADVHDGLILIIFDGGGCAPYPGDEVRPLDPADEHATYHRACAGGDCDLEHGHDGPHERLRGGAA